MQKLWFSLSQLGHHYWVSQVGPTSPLLMTISLVLLQLFRLLGPAAWRRLLFLLAGAVPSQGAGLDKWSTGGVSATAPPRPPQLLHPGFGAVHKLHIQCVSPEGRVLKYYFLCFSLGEVFILFSQSTEVVEVGEEMGQCFLSLNPMGNC